MGTYITSLVCTALHIVLRIFVTLAWFWSLRPKHVVIFLNKNNVIVFDENNNLLFKFMNTTECPL